MKHLVVGADMLLYTNKETGASIDQMHGYVKTEGVDAMQKKWATNEKNSKTFRCTRVLLLAFQKKKQAISQSTVGSLSFLLLPPLKGNFLLRIVPV